MVCARQHLWNSVVEIERDGLSPRIAEVQNVAALSHQVDRQIDRRHVASGFHDDVGQLAAGDFLEGFARIDDGIVNRVRGAEGHGTLQAEGLNVESDNACGAHLSQLKIEEQSRRALTDNGDCLFR